MPIAITLDRTIDAGAILTVVTILGGILAWCFREWRAWRRSEEQRAKDGALRLLLAILRQSDNPMTFDQLRAAFSAADRKKDRQEYCKKDFSFVNPTEFEAAVYRLDWEGKIDFLDANTIAF